MLKYTDHSLPLASLPLDFATAGEIFGAFSRKIEVLWLILWKITEKILFQKLKLQKSKTKIDNLLIKKQYFVWIRTYLKELLL